MKIVPCVRVQCIAARSQGLYQAEEFIPCYSDLHLNTTTAGKLVTLQRVKEILDILDKDLDQRLPAQDSCYCAASRHTILARFNSESTGVQRVMRGSI